MTTNQRGNDPLRGEASAINATGGSDDAIDDGFYQSVDNADDGRLIVAIDGPSGTGKSTVSRQLAAAFGARYLDTGAMYRVATLHVLNKGVDPADEVAVVAATTNLPLVISDDPASTKVMLDGVDVSAAIRSPEVTATVSQVSSYEQVRDNLVTLQRRLAAAAGRIVAEGRDVGTVVLPGAPVKIYLTASPTTRAKRRYGQLIAAGQTADFDEVLNGIVRRDEFDSTRAHSPLHPADDAVIVDTSNLEFDEVVDRLVDLVLDSAADGGYIELEDDEDEIEQPLSRHGVVDEDQIDELEKTLERDNPDSVEEALCTVAIVGRPNVGKSSLVNRFLGRREAVVEDFPGVTRDRISYLGDWNGKRFWVQDTGGWDPDAKGIHGAIAKQAEAAMASADVIVMVVDCKVGVTETDSVMAKKLQRAKVPVILVANKFDSDSQLGDVAEFWSLGLGNPFPVSAQHGRGGADVLDLVVESFPKIPRSTFITGGPRRVALIGRPNVGKSSLLNKLSGENRSVVDNVAGTTVDPVDSIVALKRKTWRFVDTAGLRRKVKSASGHEFYASLRTKSAIDSAEVCVLLIDASEPITEQDQRVLQMIIDSGRALVVAYNKWDLVDEDRRDDLEREIEQQLAHIPWARRINVSALTGRALNRLEPAMIEALESWDQRISTGQLNNWLRGVIAQNPPPARGGRIPRVLFATQAGTRPPVIVLFTTGFLEHGYRRYIERKLRESFGFVGSPVRVAVRIREKREMRRR